MLDIKGEQEDLQTQLQNVIKESTKTQKFGINLKVAANLVTEYIDGTTQKLTDSNETKNNNHSEIGRFMFYLILKGFAQTQKQNAIPNCFTKLGLHTPTPHTYPPQKFRTFPGT